MPTGRSASKISSLRLLLIASRISPSLEINSVYIRSAPQLLHTARNGGSLTSSIGASSSGKSGNSMFSILTTGLLFGTYLRAAKVHIRNGVVMQTYLKTRSVGMQSLIFISLVASGLLIFVAMLGTWIAVKSTGLSLFQISDVANWDTADPRFLLFLRLMLVMQFLGLFLVPVLVFAYLSDPQPAKYLGFRKTEPLFLALGVLAIIAAIPLVEYLGFLNQKIVFPHAVAGWMKTTEKEAEQQIGMLLQKHTVSNLILNVVLVAGFAAIGEELFFRGVLQRLFIWGFK